MAKKKLPTPRWAKHVLAAIYEAITPINPLGEIGFVLDRGQAPVAWEMKVFPLLNELWGGPQDGKRVPPGFALCLSRLSQLFDTPPHLDWITPSFYTGLFDGPHIRLEGEFHDERLLLLFFDQPPAGTEVSLIVNAFTGKVRESQEPA